MPNVDEIFLEFSTSQLKQLSTRIQDCLSRLTDEQIWRRSTDQENAIGNLVLHLCGNLGQWLGTGVAGRPNTRDRDAEFAARGAGGRAELSQKLENAVADAEAILRGVSAERLVEAVNVQKYHVTVLEAVYHVVEHFAQHTGQIIFATKLLTGTDLEYYKHLSAKTAVSNPTNHP